jgi:hypothetical protein
MNRKKDAVAVKEPVVEQPENKDEIPPEIVQLLNILGLNPSADGCESPESESEPQPEVELDERQQELVRAFDTSCEKVKAALNSEVGSVPNLNGIMQLEKDFGVMSASKNVGELLAESISAGNVTPPGVAKRGFIAGLFVGQQLSYEVEKGRGN